MPKKLIEIYMYNDDNIFAGTQLIKDIREIGIETEDGLVLPKGLTSIKPSSNLYIASNVSPKFIGDRWVENNEAAVKRKKLTAICVNKLREIIKSYNS